MSGLSTEVRVFLSSTFLDLRELRDEVRRRLSEIFGAHLITMETFGSDDAEPKISSVRRVIEKVTGASLNEQLKRKSSRAQVLHEVFFSLNSGFAVTFAVLAFAYGGQAIRTSAGYFLLPGEHFFVDQAGKINRLMRLYAGSDTGREITACVSILLIALSVFLVLRLVAATAWIRTVLYTLGGVTSIALFPLLWLHVLQATWTVSDEHLYPFWRSASLSFFAVEVPLVCAFFFLARKWRYQVLIGAVVLLLHYTLWTGQVWWIFSRIPLWSPKLFYFVLPGSGFAWLFYSGSDGG